jgi:hypothetical protein
MARGPVPLVAADLEPIAKCLQNALFHLEGLGDEIATAEPPPGPVGPCGGAGGNVIDFAKHRSKQGGTP